MPVPVPQYAIEEACSTIFENTLYSYSPKAFQSLALEEGTAWTTIQGGVSVTGGVCVKSTPKDKPDTAALYIVGGISNSTDYEGLQRFTFATGKWETIRPTVPVTQNRVYHGAVYLNASDSILVYAGSQDGSKALSSQTFTIRASEPYSVLAYESIAPPAMSPTLIPWSDTEALYIGGSNTNTKAMLFSSSAAWVESKASLAEPLVKTSAIIIDGDDGSKMLYTFDMSISPNQVNRTVLIDGNGSAIRSSKPIFMTRDLVSGLVAERSEHHKERNLTAANWPTYNSTLAPSSTRGDYSVAGDENGLVVISGGNTDDVLCMFTAKENCWVNATAKLVSKSTSQQRVGIDSTPTSVDLNPTGSSASAATSSETANGTPAAGIKFPIKILIAVLSSIVGVALILLAILLLLRWKRKKRQHSDAGHQRRASGISAEKSSLDLSGMPQMSSTRQLRNHDPQPSAGSFSSMAILMGRTSQKKGDRNSIGSASSSQFNKKYKTAISNPIPQEQSNGFGPSQETPGEKPLADERAAVPRPRGNGGRRGSTRRSSGWNRYWSGGSALNIIGFGSKRTTVGSEAESSSQYSSDHRPSQLTQHSATVPPLKLAGPPGLNRVATGSPTVEYTSSRYPLTREMSGQIERSSIASDSSYDDDDRRDAFSSGVPASVHEQNSSWDPVDRPGWGTGRGQSSAYSESNYAPRDTMLSLPRDARFPVPPKSSEPPVPKQDMSWLNLGGENRTKLYP